MPTNLPQGSKKDYVRRASYTVPPPSAKPKDYSAYVSPDPRRHWLRTLVIVVTSVAALGAVTAGLVYKLLGG